LPRKLTYYVGATLDGFIAGSQGEIDFFPIEQDVVEWIAAEYPETLPTHARQALGIDAPNSRFDCVVQGRATYGMGLDEGITSPFAHLDQYVVSSSLGTSPDPAVTVIANDPLGAVKDLKRGDGLGVWLAGGGSVAGQLVSEIDELVVKSYPVAIGSGVPMFRDVSGPVQLELTNTLALPGGTVVSVYSRPD